MRDAKGHEFKMKRLNTKGLTIVEVVISCVVISIMFIATFAILQFSLNNWRAIEDRGAVQAELQRVHIDLSEELTKSSLGSVIIHDKDYRKTIAFRTYTDKGDTPYILTDATGNPEAKGYVLYSLVRPATDTCDFSDEHCPHKILIRVNLTRNAGKLDLSGDSPRLVDYIPIGEGGTSGKIAGFKTRNVSVEQYKNTIMAVDKSIIDSVYVVGRDIISFQPAINTPVVSLSIKGFKHLEAGRFMTKADMAKPTDSRFVVELTSEIIPLNAEI
jgi:hypothetical protein